METTATKSTTVEAASVTAATGTAATAKAASVTAAAAKAASVTAATAATPTSGRRGWLNQADRCQCEQCNYGFPHRAFPFLTSAPSHTTLRQPNYSSLDSVGGKLTVSRGLLAVSRLRSTNRWSRRSTPASCIRSKTTSSCHDLRAGCTAR